MQRRIHQSIPEQGKWLRQVLTGFFFAQLPLIDPYDRKVFCGRRAPNVRSKSQTKKGVRLRERGEDAKLIVRFSREDIRSEKGRPFLRPGNVVTATMTGPKGFNLGGLANPVQDEG